MGAMRCAEVRHTLGVYVLGAVDPAERSQVDAHLTDCAACRGELAALAGLPALLARLPAESLDDGSAGHEPAETDPALLDRLLARVVSGRRRLRLLVVSAAAGVVVLLAAGGTAAYVAGDSGGPQPPESAVTLSGADAGSGVRGEVTLRPRSWGTDVTVRLSGVPENTTCSLVAVGEEGRRSVAASWYVAYDGGVDVDGAAALRPAGIAEFAVVTSEGERLLTIPVRDAGQAEGGSRW